LAVYETVGKEKSMTALQSDRNVDYSKTSRQLNNFVELLRAQRKRLSLALLHDVAYTRRNFEDRELAVVTALLAKLQPDISLPNDPSFDLLAREPIGRVAVLLPYNAPLIATAMAVGAAYFMGNKEILVHVPGRMERFSEVFRDLLESSLPGVTVHSGRGEVFLKRCLADPDMRAVVCFGGDEWMRTYREAFRRTNCKLIFEGPGKDPFIVFADANLESAAKAAVSSSFTNAGQSCSATERFYVHRDCHEEFVDRIVELSRRYRVGLPEADDTDIGPIGSSRVIARLREQLRDARQRGARCLVGGDITEMPGSRYPVCSPTILTACTNDMSIMQDETFGPVIPIVAFAERQEGLSQADNCRYGLTATVFGGDEHDVDYLRPSHGNVFHGTCITDAQNFASRLYWGGYRNSGWVWEWKNSQYLWREGPRYLVAELSAKQS
jgi:succinate-semialdehyde dehydrogenase/glutarate-semialdehyde dehydrogenase